MAMKHFYRDVPRLGNVAVSRHAQARMEADGISQEVFDKALFEPTRPDVPDGMDIFWRERNGLRSVIITNPTPNTGAKLVKTVNRVQGQACSSPDMIRPRGASVPDWRSRRPVRASDVVFSLTSSKAAAQIGGGVGGPARRCPGSSPRSRKKRVS